MSKILKKDKSIKEFKRHFTIVIKNKENGLYISSRPLSAAKKAVSKLCASNKQKKVEFHIREITHGSKKKTYGPYIGYLEKLKIPIKFKEYIIKYNPIVKLIKKLKIKKVRMRGGTKKIWTAFRGKFTNIFPEIIIETNEEGIKKYKKFPYLTHFLIDHDSFETNDRQYIINLGKSMIPQRNNKRMRFVFRDDITDKILQTFIQKQSQKMIKKFQELELKQNVIVYLRVPYTNDDGESEPTYERIEYLKYEPEVASSARNPDSDSEVASSSRNPDPNSNSDSEVASSSRNFSKIINSIYKPENKLYLNIALNKIGIKKVLQLFREFLTAFHGSLPIISIGSGMAYFEYLIQEVFKTEVVCIDPDPIKFSPNPFLSSNKKLFITPEFNIVDNLLSSKNSKKYTDSLLILNWPTPSIGSYDLDAIIKLKPRGFFIIYEREGKAGSEELIDKLRERQPIQFEEGLSYELLKKKESHEHKLFAGIMDVDYDYIVASYRRIEP